MKNLEQLFDTYGLEVIKFEQYLYQSATHFSDDYKGGLWESLNVKGDSGFYLLLNDEKTYHLKSDYGELAVNSKTFSLAVFAYSVNMYGWYLYERDNTSRFATELFYLYHFTMRNAHKILKKNELKSFYLFLD